MPNPVASVEIKARSNSLDAELRKARAKFHQFGDGVTDDFTRKGKKKGAGGGAMGSLLGNVGANVLGRVEGLFEDSARSVMRYDDALVRLQIQAESTPEAMGAFSKSVRAASNATGMDAEKILGAATAYVTLTGDMKTATASTALWAKVAQATNSNVDDIAKTAAAMTQNLKVTPEEMEATFSALAIEGKKGAIELKDLASQMSTIAPMWAQFDKGTGTRGVRELGAALQIVKRGFGGDAGETVTGLQSLLTSITKHAGKFEAHGVKVFNTDKDGVQSMRDVYSIIDDIGKSDLAKHPEAMIKAFGRVEAYRAYVQLHENKEELHALNAAASDGTAIQRDFGTYMESTAGKISTSLERAKNRMAEVFTPERIDKFAAALSKAVDGFAKLIDYGEKLIGIVDTITQPVGDSDKVDILMSTGEDQSPAAKIKRANELRGQTAAQLDESGLGYTTQQRDAAVAQLMRDATMPSTATLIQASIAGVGGKAAKAGRQSGGLTHGGGDPAVLAELKKISAHTAAGTKVQVGSDTIAKASKEAAAHRRGVKP